jgi:ABC-type glycerol-3-phosphate transport system substrate-binding protein
MLLRHCLPAVALACAGLLAGCDGRAAEPLTLSGSAVGGEADIVQRQLQRFRAAHPATPVALRATPDAADQRHQLYVQWLNGHATSPDVLQLDVVWTAEFAAAGWIAPLDRFQPETHQFFQAAVDAQRWRGSLYALPWFMDVGLLYWRTDLVAQAPGDLPELARTAQEAQTRAGIPFGFVWQGARYEGLVTVFLELLGAYGGTILDADGAVAVDSDAAVQALTFMRDAIRMASITPAAALGWQEEQTRFAFQNGQAVYMRNWPYARPLLADATQSAVAGRFAVAAMPGTPDGAPSSALGGSVLAINAFSTRQDEAYALVQFLLAPEQMLERARVTGQYPPRPALYDAPELGDALGTDPRLVRQILDHAVSRPSTPVYSELSELLQISLHRALSGQQDPRSALQDAARAIRALLARVKLQPEVP